jgi:hypothetical protein
MRRLRRSLPGCALACADDLPNVRANRSSSGSPVEGFEPPATNPNPSNQVPSPARGSHGSANGIQPGRLEWAILLDKTTTYIKRSWKTEAEARLVLADLLRPYPSDNVWRYRLTLGQVLVRTKGKENAAATGKKTGQEEA